MRDVLHCRGIKTCRYLVPTYIGIYQHLLETVVGKMVYEICLSFMEYIGFTYSVHSVLKKVS